MAEVLFESLQVEQLLPIKAAGCVAFGCARTSSVVLDLGHARTTVSVVSDGQVRKGFCRVSEMGGAALSDAFEHFYQSKYNRAVPALYRCLEPTTVDHPFVQPDFEAFSRTGVLEGILNQHQSLTADKVFPDGTSFEDQMKTFDPASAILQPNHWSSIRVTDTQTHKAWIDHLAALHRQPHERSTRSQKPHLRVPPTGGSGWEHVSNRCPARLKCHTLPCVSMLVSAGI